jgi:hypothetical protein
MERASREGLAVSNIPSDAVSSALTPISRQTHDAARARKLQHQKNAHHAEDIEELNDSGVDSIDDRKREQEKREEQEEKESEEKVEIASLKKQAAGGAAAKKASPEKTSRLDISA